MAKTKKTTKHGIKNKILNALNRTLGEGGFELTVDRISTGPASALIVRGVARPKDTTRVGLKVRVAGRDASGVSVSAEALSLQAQIHDAAIDEALEPLIERWTLSGLGFTGRLSTLGAERVPPAAREEGASS